MHKLKLLSCVVMLVFGAQHVQGSNIAIISGDYYSEDLRDALVARGETVTELDTYDLATLQTYDAVIHYGNSYVDLYSLEDYVIGGGTLVETPWFWSNYHPQATLQIFQESEGGTPNPSESYPGVIVLQANSPLLCSVDFPTDVGSFNIGRTVGTTFAEDVEQIAVWADGTAMIGTKTLGLGTIVGINLQVITNDTAYEVINQAWATQLLVNAVDPGQCNVCNCTAPEPSSVALLAIGGLGLAFGPGRRRKVA